MSKALPLKYRNWDTYVHLVALFSSLKTVTERIHLKHLSSIPRLSSHQQKVNLSNVLSIDSYLLSSKEEPCCPVSYTRTWSL